MLKIRLKRLGAKKNPTYRIIVINSTTKREGRPIQELGHYNPKTKLMKLDKATALDWISKVALEVLSMMPGDKVVVTPGMVELGAEEERYNKEFGEEISSVADYVILVGEKQTKPIYEGLMAKKYDKDRIIITNDVRQTYILVNKLKGNKVKR